MQADESFHVETNGFTQSLNVSVAAAVVFHQLSLALPRPTDSGMHWPTSPGTAFVFPCFTLFSFLYFRLMGGGAPLPKYRTITLYPYSDGTLL
jgi:hypothetical protein